MWVIRIETRNEDMEIIRQMSLNQGLMIFKKWTNYPYLLAVYALEILLLLTCLRASQVALVVKNPPANAGDKKCWFDPWVGKIVWKRAWQPTPVFLPGESHGQYSCLENPMDRGAWWVTVLGVTQSRTRLKRLSMAQHDLLYV